MFIIEEQERLTSEQIAKLRAELTASPLSTEAVARAIRMMKHERSK